MSQKAHLQTMIRESTRRLQKLREQQARQETNTDPDILLQIEDLEAQITNLSEELRNLPADDDDGEEALPSADALDDSASQQQGSSRVINTGGGNYFEGNVNTSGGEFVGGNKVVTYNYGASAADLGTLFAAIQAQIKNRPEDPDVDKEEISAEVERIEQEVAKGEGANPRKVARWLGNLAAMAPDILEVTVASLTNPAAGVATVIRKIAEKAREEAP